MWDEKRDSLGQLLIGAEQNLRDELDELERHVRANPLRTLLTAAGIGVLLGLAISRHR